VLVINNNAAEALGEGKVDRLERIMSEGEYYEMQTFDQSLLALYRRGLVEREAALSAATYAPSLRLELEQVDRTKGDGATTRAPGLPTAPSQAPPPVGPPMALPPPAGVVPAPAAVPAFPPPVIGPVRAD
jgi:hypothetical protein